LNNVTFTAEVLHFLSEILGV